MKKQFVLALVMIIVLVSGSVLACAAPAPAPAPSPAPAPAPSPAPAPAPAPAPSPAPAPAPSPAPAPAPAPAPSPAQPEMVHNWKVQSHHPSTSKEYESIARIAEKITSISGGRINIEMFGVGAIAPSTKELEGASKGVIQGASNFHNDNQYMYPAASLFAAVVGGLTSVQAMMWFAEEGDDLVSRMTSNLNVQYIGTPYIDLPEIWAHSKEPITSLADLQKLKMRVSGEAGEIFGRIGVSTVYIPGVEIYESAQRGVIDAFEWGTAQLNWNNGIQEVADYLYLSPSRAPRTGNGFWINRDAWEALTPDLQEMIYEVTLAETFSFANRAALEGGYLQNFIEYGTVVEFLPQDIEDELLREAVVYYDEKATEDAFYAEVLTSQRNFQAAMNLLNVR